jgi:hypothetical protein
VDKNASSSEANALDLEKRRLECEKLRAEISQVELAWWKRPGYIGSIAPILIALVGFLSVWSTGFFETQRAELRSEIEKLETEQKDLSNNNQKLVQASAEIQNQIDQAYISIKMAIAESSYALSHMRAAGPALTDTDHGRIEMILEEMPADVSELVQQLLSKEKLTQVIVPITEKELQGLDKMLEFIPASEWAAELQPMIGPIPLLSTPDGRIYNPADGNFYEKFEDIENK